jgi:hypothetical protein
VARPSTAARASANSARAAAERAKPVSLAVLSRAAAGARARAGTGRGALGSRFTPGRSRAHYSAPARLMRCTVPGLTPPGSRPADDKIGLVVYVLLTQALFG